eukprot:m.169076 g.169076  ORF g.169076 m.169076 type:complete len:70 (+) comp15325_c0_seq2:3247-3456(+)
MYTLLQVWEFMVVGLCQEATNSLYVLMVCLMFFSCLVPLKNHNVKILVQAPSFPLHYRCLPKLIYQDNC